MYSRRIKVEEIKNKRRAILFLLLTLALLSILFFWGIPTIAKFAAFLTDLRSSSETPTQEDTTPPPPPRIEALPKAIKESNVEVRGVAEQGSTVILSLNNKKSEVVANSEGQFSFNLSLTKGENTIFLFAKDRAGNESKETDLYKIDYDTTPPELEIYKPAEDSEFFGAKQRQIIIDGKTEPNTKIQINDRFVVVESNGSFAFTTTLYEGQNTFILFAEDEAGNKTEKSLTVTFIP